jgi:membrane protein YqaA with SNARE-associated domain
MKKKQVNAFAWISTLGWTFGSVMGWAAGYLFGEYIGDQFPTWFNPPQNPPDLDRAIASQNASLIFGLLGLMLGWSVSAFIMSMVMKNLWQENYPTAEWKHVLRLFAGWVLPAAFICTACSLLNLLF